MAFETIIVKESSIGVTVVLNRLERENSINAALLEELHQMLDMAEQNPELRLIILEGQNGVFCTGMDFKAFAQESEEMKIGVSSEFMKILKRFTLSPKVIVSNVDGRVMAGGVGIAAASDIVIATPRTRFNLSEILWGLLPACVTPFLIRRVGFQKAYRMTLTTQSLTAKEAYEANLVDELSQAPEDSIRKLFLKLRRLDESAIRDMKRYFRKMWIITSAMEEAAISEISRLVSDPKVNHNIVNYVNYQKFPWETR